MDCNIGIGRGGATVLCLLATGDGTGLELLWEVVSETIDEDRLMAETLVLKSPARKELLVVLAYSPPVFTCSLALEE